MHKRLILVSLLGIVMLASPLAGSASTLSIFMTGLDLTYDGWDITSNPDVVNAQGAWDHLFSAQFSVDGSFVQQTAAFANVKIGGVTGLSAAGTVTTSTVLGQGFDLYFPIWNEWINLDWDSPVNINLNNNSGALSIGGSASTSTGSQSFPFFAGPPIQVTFSQQITSFEAGPRGVVGSSSGVSSFLAGDPYITSFKSFGTGEMTGPFRGDQVPEPASLLLLGGGLAVGFLRKRGRK